MLYFGTSSTLRFFFPIAVNRERFWLATTGLVSRVVSFRSRSSYYCFVYCCISALSAACGIKTRIYEELTVLKSTSESKLFVSSSLASTFGLSS